MDPLIEAADAMLAQPGYIAANPGAAEGILHRLRLAAKDPTRSEEVRKQVRERVAAMELTRQPVFVPGSCATG